MISIISMASDMIILSKIYEKLHVRKIIKIEMPKDIIGTSKTEYGKLKSK